MNIINKLLVKQSNLFYLLFPIIISYIVIAICPMKKNIGSNIKFRPPSYIFGIVWPILYILLGYAWVNAKEYSIFYLLLSLSLASWLVVYSCFNNKSLALGVILLSILLVLICYTLSNLRSKLLLLPLLVWLFFALLLSVFNY